MYPKHFEKNHKPQIIIGSIDEETESFVNKSNVLQQYIVVRDMLSNKKRTLTLFDDLVEKLQEVPKGSVISFSVKRRDVYSDKKIQKWFNVIDFIVKAG